MSPTGTPLVEEPVEAPLGGALEPGWEEAGCDLEMKTMKRIEPPASCQQSSIWIYLYYIYLYSIYLYISIYILYISIYYIQIYNIYLYIISILYLSILYISIYYIQIYNI